MTITHPSQSIFSGLLTKVLGTAAALLAAATFAAPNVASAAGTVQFIAPPDGSSAPVGTSVTPDGLASGTGTTGTGLDLVIVLDSSGSMGTITSGQTRQQWQRDAAIALVNSLPVSTSSVSIVEFDSSASTVIGLTPLIPAANVTAIIAAINGVDASGGTTIGSGIDAATGVLTGAGATAGRSKQMVVISDGSSSGDPGAAAAAAVAAGVGAVHSVAIPGAVVSTMADIATSGNGFFANFSDPTDLASIVGVFSGTGGSLVGVDHIAITLPDGTVIDPNSISGLGAFSVDLPFALALGPNTWNVTAFFTDGTQATDAVTVHGVAAPIPLPAALPLLLMGLGGLGVLRSRRKRQA